MATPAQIAANQSNAQFSKGPVTPEGKAASAQNRLKLGFRSNRATYPHDVRTTANAHGHDDPAEYEALLEELTTHFGPTDLTRTDLTEDRFVREMADAEWRLRRVRTCMSAALARQMEKLAAEFPDLAHDHIARESRAIETLAETGCSHATWLRYETKFERQYDRAHREWSRYQADRRRISDKEADIAMRQAIFAPMPTAKSTAAKVQGKPAQGVTNGLLIPTKSDPCGTTNGQGMTNGLLVPTKADPCGTTNGPLASNVQNAQTIARNAPCPCKSGEKYKRCCGRSATGQIHTSSPRSSNAA